jgi:hypothetical protein
MRRPSLIRPNVARRDRRTRLTGRLGVTKGERYALLPDEVLQSEAVRELDGVSRWVLVCISAQYHGRNNGRLTLPYSAAVGYGIRSKDSLTRGLRQLVEHGLLEITHQGGLPPLGCSRYALAWKSVDADEKLGIVGTLNPSNAWAKWQNASPTTGPVCPDHRTTDTHDCPDHRTTEGALLVRPPGTSKTLGQGGQVLGPQMSDSIMHACPAPDGSRPLAASGAPSSFADLSPPSETSSRKSDQSNGQSSSETPARVQRNLRRPPAPLPQVFQALADTPEPQLPPEAIEFIRKAPAGEILCSSEGRDGVNRFAIWRVLD